jgi:hypothetical protein
MKESLDKEINVHDALYQRALASVKEECKANHAKGCHLSPII